MEFYYVGVQLGNNSGDCNRNRCGSSGYPTDSNLDEPTESQVDDSPIESTQYSFIIDTTVISSDPKEISNTYDFGDYAKSAKVTTSTVESENGQAFIVSYTLNEEALVDLNLKYVQEETES